MANDRFIDSLSDKIWKTKNARFTAYKRMKRSNVSSVIATAMASADIILINMLCYMKNGDDTIANTDNVTAFSIMLSVLALVLSLVVSLLHYQDRCSNYHCCGIELDALNQQIKLRKEHELTHSAPITMEEIQKFLAEYRNILQKYNLNHTTFDYDYAKYLVGEDDEDKKNRLNLAVMWIRWNIFDVNFLYWVIALVPLAVIMVYIGLSST